MRDYIDVLVRRSRLICGTVLSVVAVAVAGVLLLPDRYTARLTLRVATPGSLSGDPVRGDAPQYLDRLQNTYASLASSDTLRERLRRELGLSERPEVSLTPKPASELMSLRVTAPNAAAAARAANTLASMLTEEVRRLETEPQSLATLDEIFNKNISTLEEEIARSQEEKDSLERTPNRTDAMRQRLLQLETDIQVKSVAAGQQRARYDQLRAALIGGPKVLTVVSPATPPDSPDRPSLAVTAALALVVGACAGVGLAALFERLRTTVERRDEVEDAAGVPVIAEVALSPDAENRREILAEAAPGAEVFRRLRTEVLVETERRAVRSLLVTSADGEAETGWVAVNLAVALARAGQRVVLLDGDLSAPWLHQMFGVRNNVGVTDVLGEGSSLDLVAVRTMVPGLTFVPAGRSFDSAGDAVTPGRLTKLVEELESSFELVVVHASDVLGAADARSFAAVIPTVILVAARGRTARTQLAQVSRQLGDAESSVLGAVFAGASSGPGLTRRAGRVRRTLKEAEVEARRVRTEAEAESDRIRRDAERRDEEAREAALKLRQEGERQAAAILETARKGAEGLAQRLRDDAEAEVASMLARGREETEAERRRVLTELSVESERQRQEIERYKAQARAEAEASSRALLQAAEQDVKRLRDEVARFLAEARSEADARREEADGYASRLLAEAETSSRAQREAAEQHANQLRHEAESQAGHILAEAETRANELRMRAERARAEADQDAQWLRQEAEAEVTRVLTEAEEMLAEAEAEAVRILANAEWEGQSRDQKVDERSSTAASQEAVAWDAGAAS